MKQINVNVQYLLENPRIQEYMLNKLYLGNFQAVLFLYINYLKFRSGRGCLRLWLNMFQDQ